MKWSVVYGGAFNDDGSLAFPSRLTKDFLAQVRKTMGPYKFSNQYLNKVIPDEEQDFKKSWLRTYTQLPERYFTFVFIDPAISLSDTADYTATIVAHVDSDKNWYISLADRRRITATETVDWIFKVFGQYKPMALGIEDVAYQRALYHFLVEEMHRRNQFLPIKAVKRSVISTAGEKRDQNSKPLRIRSLIPRFEFGKIYLAQGLDDFILEYSSFPRGAHDDLLDAMASIEEVVAYPDKPKETENVQNPNHPDYERHFIRRLAQRKQEDY